MSYCFLNLVYNDGENKAYELVKFSNDTPMSFTLEYLNESGIESLYNKGEYRFDFSVENRYLIWDGREISVSKHELEKILERKPVLFKNKIGTIYDMLWKLNSLNAVFVPKKEKENLLSGGTVKYLPSFNSLKISESTMNVYFTVLSDDGWRTQSIIKMKDGVLAFFSFDFAVKTKDIATVKSSYPVEEVKTVDLYGEKYTVFHVADGIPIYPMMVPGFRICDPLLNFKIFISERDKRAINLLDFFLKGSLEALSDKEDEKEEPERIPRVYDMDSKYNVLFRLKCPKFTGDDREMLIRNVSKILKKIQSEGWNMKQAQQHLASLNYTFLNKFAGIVLLQALSDPKATNILDKLENVKHLLIQLKDNKMRNDLELFMYRSYIYMTNYRFPADTTNYFLSGGTSVYISEIVKKVKGGA